MRWKVGDRFQFSNSSNLGEYRGCFAVVTEKMTASPFSPFAFPNSWWFVMEDPNHPRAGEPCHVSEQYMLPVDPFPPKFTTVTDADAWLDSYT